MAMTVSRDLSRDGWSWSLSDGTVAVASDCGIIDTATYCVLWIGQSKYFSVKARAN